MRKVKMTFELLVLTEVTFAAFCLRSWAEDTQNDWLSHVGGTQYTTLVSFGQSASTGYYPSYYGGGSPLVIGNSIYGMTDEGGGGEGVIFEFGLPMKVFVSSSTYSGSLGGPSGADALCASDSNNPNDGHTYKALIVDGSTRVACTSANCASGGSSENVDWVISPGTEYVQSDSATVIATSTSNGIFSFPLTTGLSASNLEEWTGLSSDWTTGTSTCSAWSSSSSSVDGEVGQSSSSTSVTTIEGASSACNANNHLYCVEQL